MSPLRRLSLAFEALRQLGPNQVGLYAWYRLGLKTGYLRSWTKDERLRRNDFRPSSFVLRPLFDLPKRESLAAVLGERAALLLAEADEVLAGRVRLFGGEPVSLLLQVPGPLDHWTVYDKRIEDRGVGDQGFVAEDIKFIWEPGRFGWAYILGRAYYLTGDESYAGAFWEQLEEFLERNPPYLGPHWASAQEVALRLIALNFTAQLFGNSPASTPERRTRLGRVIASHARRIPPTLAYARAQNNNHLLSEAAGLYTAGLTLPGHPEAQHWREMGWRWLNRGLQDQVAPDGTYSQHSANYHRLMLQLALWADLLAGSTGESFPDKTRTCLAAATRWLLALVDRETGRVPNLGPNDGASIQPLSTCPLADYRPVVQAAARAFLGEPVFAPGPWDELGLWILGDIDQGDRGIGDRDEFPIPYSPTPLSQNSPHVLRNPDHTSWVYFRVARFSSRPGHADQLHLDLWWRGLNVAQDAGTFQYNAPPPWTNALAGSAVHNTITVNGQDQMQRAGQFLWLDWAQGVVEAGEHGPDGAWVRVAASHDGYRRLGIRHRREVTACPEGRWVVEDRLLPVEGSRLNDPGSGLKVQPASRYLQTYNARLHWLMPDWPWRLAADSHSTVLMVESPYGPIELRMRFVKGKRGSQGPCARFETGDNQGPGNIQDSLDGRTLGVMLQGFGWSEDPKRTRRQHYRLNTGLAAQPELKAQVVRAGEVLYGEGQAEPTWGWVSPTYGAKVPALSVAVTIISTLPICLTSEWIFPPDERASSTRREAA